MARWGRCDFGDLKRYQKQLERLRKKELDAFSRACVKELAARLLRLVVKRTPVGQYSGGKVGGTLRRGWTVGEITKASNAYQVEIINPVEYALTQWGI